MPDDLATNINVRASSRLVTLTRVEARKKGNFNFTELKLKITP
jgi:hypothetical protein